MKLRAVIVLMLTLPCALAATLTIKLGSVIPPNSPWDRNLRILGADWASISAGRVTLKIYPGGVAGDEPDMLRKMRFGQLQAAGLSPLGLSQVSGAALAPATPLLVQTEEELYHVLRGMEPLFEEEFARKGFKILFWTFAGWGQFFARRPVITPEDLKRQRFWIMDGNPEEASAWKKLGYRAAVYPTGDILVQLQSGGVDAMVVSPLLAALNQWFGIANQMSDLHFLPFYGAFIISTSVWERIPAELRPAMLEAARRCGERMRAGTEAATKEAMAVMVENGLVVHHVPPEAVQEWQRFVQEGLQVFVGDKFDLSYYTKARQLVEEVRGGSAD